jgi:hypothetical protein
VKTILRVTSILILVSLVGCASTVSRNTSTVKEEKVQITKFQPIKSVNLSLNSRAKEKLPDNLNFSSDALLKKINSTLQANQYLNTNNLPTNISVEVLVTNIRTRSGVTAIMLGPLAGGDYITGDVLIKDGANTIDKFEVDVTFAWGGAMGDTDSRMNWMYESFANKMTEEIKKLMPITKN